MMAQPIVGDKWRSLQTTVREARLGLTSMQATPLVFAESQMRLLTTLSAGEARAPLLFLWK